MHWFQSPPPWVSLPVYLQFNGAETWEAVPPTWRENWLRERLIQYSVAIKEDSLPRLYFTLLYTLELVIHINFQKDIPRHTISTDEDPGLRIKSFAVINLRGVATNNSVNSIIYFIAMQTYKELKTYLLSYSVW
jgi:hypothetical protein